MHRSMSLTVICCAAYAVSEFVFPGRAFAAAATPAAQGDSSDALEEITVSSRRREERLEDVPIAVTAISGEELDRQGAADITDMFAIAPSLYFSQGNFTPTKDFTYLTIRGVGAAPALDPSVGVFIDGAYQPHIGFDLDFLDLDRLEILRGPQSTLFGRNTEAGAINLVTRKPSTDAEAKFRVEFDNFGGLIAQSSLSGPLADNLFGNFAVRSDHTNGYITNTLLGEHADKSDSLSVRSALRWVGDGLEMYLTGDYTDVRANEIGWGVPDGCKCYTINSDPQTTDHRKIYGVAFTLDADLGWSKLTSLTSYRAASSDALWNAAGATYDHPFFDPAFPAEERYVNGFDSRKTFENHLAEDLRFASPDSPGSMLQWLAGAYVFREDNNPDRLGNYTSVTPGAPNVIFDGSEPGGEGVFIRQTKKGWSAFGQLTFTPIPKLEITGGARYARETAYYNANVSFLVPTSDTAYFPFELNLDSSRSFPDFMPSGSVSYKWTDTLNTYATVSRGFKSGGFQEFPANALDAQGFDSEKSTNYEFGMKLGDRDLSLNLAAYRIKLTNMQVSATVLIDTGNGTTEPVGGVRNAAEGTVTGGEAEIAYRPLRALELQASVSYNDTKFTNYVDAQGLQRDGSPYQHFPYVPEVTGSVRAQYTGTIKDVEVRPSLAWRYIGHYYVGDGGTYGPFEHIPSYQITDFRLAFTKDNWTVTAFVDNVFDTYAITTRQTTLADDTHLFDTPLPPRRAGLRVDYHF